MKRKNPYRAVFKDVFVALLFGFLTIQILAGCVALSPAKHSSHATDFHDAAQIVAAVLVLEARSEGPIGEIAVANVIVNRSKKSPDGLLLQIFKPNQFAVVTGKSPKELIAEARYSVTGEDWDNAVEIASTALLGELPDLTNGATYFHSGPVPSWALKLEFTGRIGHHFFYK